MSAWTTVWVCVALTLGALAIDAVSVRALRRRAERAQQEEI